ncbi:ABC transporter ATP-binding protein [Aquella oligotrophica]|uniref:Lipoprotein-releasing system ATP-binding protein LolD n=1 Tax=Aquella oligotrophica TaxID=2067065 RepID=A0A2I7N9G0_9NEIS|nr:ATP-binding cassette domain-containing protein [Aquella oligotrophica]AUR52885.1 lipoprotein-releasing system ATP-binding protein LolD [Aquella oligotrophica]
MNNNYILQTTKLSKSFTQSSGDKLQIFSNINFNLEAGATVSIVGSSGSGKTSLLQILAGLDSPTDGYVSIDGENLQQMNSNQLCQLRNKKLGFIYQFHHLLPEFTALENTLMPLIIGNKSDKQGKEYANYILSKLGLGKRTQHYPSQLSGGERQRVAIARAVINQPKIIFADEPTGNLDNTTAHQVLDIFLSLQQELNTSLIMVTHDHEIASRTQQKLTLHNGELAN